METLVASVSVAARQYRRAADVVFRQIGDQCVLVPVRTRPDQKLAIFTLNRVGAFLWSALEAPASEELLTLHTAAAFTVTPAEAVGDIRRFLQQLTGKGLLQVSQS